MREAIFAHSFVHSPVLAFHVHLYIPSAPFDPFLSLSSSLLDPHIKVSGKRENVKEAKEKIMSVLDTKVSTSVPQTYVLHADCLDT